MGKCRRKERLRPGCIKPMPTTAFPSRFGNYVLDLCCASEVLQDFGS